MGVLGIKGLGALALVLHDCSPTLLSLKEK